MALAESRLKDKRHRIEGAASSSISASFAEGKHNELQVLITTTGGTQGFFAEVFVTIDYTAAASGPANLTNYNNIAKSNITSINGIAIANITTLNGIS